jgi:CO/xanthine dehydrogenase FAD-binding subunit
MDLNTVSEVIRPRTLAGVPALRGGDAFLAGGTWLFSEPQTHLRRLVDLFALGWPDLRQDETGIFVPANCTLANLQVFMAPADWPAAPLVAACCDALLGSFKIKAVATVGGNLCLALPAAPMAALIVALLGECTVWQPGGLERIVKAANLITGPQSTSLAFGEILRLVHLPARALRRRAAFRKMSLTALGRSAALLIGTSDGTGFELTITAATPCPVRIGFDSFPSAPDLLRGIDAHVPLWLNDVHGCAEWRQRITYILAAEILDELAP